MPALERDREEHIISWANYVRSNSGWKKIHTEFIDAQYQKYYDFLDRLLKQANGREKLRQLMKNRM